MRDRRQPGWKTDAPNVQGSHRPAPAARLFILAELDIEDLAVLHGARLVTAPETEDGRRGEGLTI
jgi:hypothetical protein